MTPLIAARLIAADYRGPLAGEVARIDINGVTSAIFQMGTERILIIRGTDQATDWLKYNFNCLTDKLTGDKFTWHQGFLRYAQIAYAFAKDKGCTMVIGHSLGAAAASIVAVSLNIPAMAFATPRPFHGVLQPPNALLVTNYCRVDDFVTMVPPGFMGFQHVGHVNWLRPSAVQLGEEHRIVHYIELLEQMEKESPAGGIYGGATAAPSV